MFSSLRLPNYVENLHNFFVDDEDDGDIHTHSTQSRNSTFVEPVWSKKNKDLVTLYVVYVMQTVIDDVWL